MKLPTANTLQHIYAQRYKQINMLYLMLFIAYTQQSAKVYALKSFLAFHFS